jgi:tetraacyldisaccharide 4'-kinase
VFHQIYAAGARFRRHYYASHPERRRRLAQPVVSIGNLAVGGRAKTPIAAAVAARLQALGERPSILSRGYARRVATDGVVVVRDPSNIRADIDRAGDEPLMLARQLDGIAVLTCPSRYLAGRLAEQHFGCTVHVLDDGFQHFQLHRDLDLVVIDEGDLRDSRTLPAGRLREPLEALIEADGIIALDEASVQALGQGLPSWRARRKLGEGRLAEPWGAPVELTFGTALAVAGIAHPQRFFSDLRAKGWPIARELSFRDHHSYSRRDVDRIFRAARDEGAGLVVTTEKDLVRLLPFRPFRLPVAYVPLVIGIEPDASFGQWLVDSLRAARTRTHDRGAKPPGRQ